MRLDDRGSAGLVQNTTSNEAVLASSEPEMAVLKELAAPAAASAGAELPLVTVAFDCEDADAPPAALIVAKTGNEPAQFTVSSGCAGALANARGPLCTGSLPAPIDPSQFKRSRQAK